MKPRKKTPIDYLIFILLIMLFYILVIHVINAYDNSIDENGKSNILVMFQNFEASIETGIFHFERTTSLGRGLIISTLILFIFVAYQFDAAKKKKLPYKEHGSSDWSKPSILKKKQDKKFEKNIILSQNVRYSFDNEKTHLNMNIMLWAMSGGGKTYNVFLPNILNCYGCYVIVDPKMELVKKTGTSLKKNKYKIKVYNIDELENSNNYNPLAYIEKEDDIIFLVKTILMNTKADPNATANDPFWEDSSELLLLSLISYVYYEFPQEKQNIPEIVNLMEEAREMQEDNAGDDEITVLDRRMEKLEIKIKEKKEQNPKNSCPEEVVIKLYKKFQMAPKKTALSILISIASRLKFYDIEAVRNSSLSDEMELHSIGKEKMAIFIGIPPTDTSKQFLTAIMFTQIFKIIERNAKARKNGKLKITTRVMIDEAKNIGKIPNLPEVIAYVRGLNAGVMLAYQDKSQIDASYKDDAKAIIGNCSGTIFLKGTETETVKYISEKLGNATIYTTNRGRTYGRNAAHSDNEQGMTRKLLEPDEVANIDDNECIVFVEGKKFLDRKYNPKKHPNYKNLSDYKPTLIEKIKGFKINEPYEYKEEILRNRKQKEFIERKKKNYKKVDHNDQDNEGLDSSNIKFDREMKELEKYLQNEVEKIKYINIENHESKEEENIANKIKENIGYRMNELQNNMESIDDVGLDLSLFEHVDDAEMAEEMLHIMQEEAENIVTLSYEELSEESKKMYRLNHEKYLKTEEEKVKEIFSTDNKKEEIPKEIARMMTKEVSEMQDKTFDTITIISKEKINDLGRDDKIEEYNEDELEEIFEEVEEGLEEDLISL